MTDIVVTGPDGSIFHFPEGTPSGTITGAMQSHYGKSQNASPAIIPEIASGVSDALKSAGQSVADYLNPFSDARHAAYAKMASEPIGQSVLDSLKQTAGTGSALAAPLSATGGVAQAVTAPLLAHPWQALNNAVGMNLTYQQAKDQATTALMGLTPRGASPLGIEPVKAASIPLSKAPSITDLEAAKNAAYNHPDVTSLTIKPQGVEKFVQNVDNVLLNNKVDKYAAPAVQGIVDRLATPRFGPAHTVSDLDMARQSLSDVPNAERRAAAIVRKEIDNYLGNIPQSDVISGNAAAANAKMLEARGNNAAMERALEVDRNMHNASVQSATTYSGGNYNNAMRQQLRPMLKAKKGQYRPSDVGNEFIPKGMTLDEAKQYARAALGTKTGNAARYVGKLGPTGGWMGLGHVGAAAATGGKSIPLSIATILARMAGNASTTRQAEILSQMLRMRSPLGQSLSVGNYPKLAIPPKALAAILAARSGAYSPALSGMMPAYANQNKP